MLFLEHLKQIFLWFLPILVIALVSHFVLRGQRKKFVENLRKRQSKPETYKLT
jgi:cytochrome c-type biogenesis protein CcmH/NrfF